MLTEYNKKRNFKNTPEPAGDKQIGVIQHRFVVQRHEASRLHYDFRLELNGVLKSWAVPKGPSLNSADRRFAVQTEDHPVAYINFKGVIPEGNYGAGKMEIWDKGVFMPVDEKGKDLTDKQAAAWLKKGQLKFNLKGKKLKGGFALVQLKDNDKNWLMIKHKDKYAVTATYNPDEGRTTNTKKTGVKKTPAATFKNNATEKKARVKKKSLPASVEKEKAIKVNGHTLQLTNLTKIYWPKDKITKGALIKYYDAIATIILPYLKNRPLSLKRNINGINEKAFFQKEAGPHFPDWIKTAPFHADSTGKTVNYTICNDKATLLYLANLACIEMNPWNSTITSPDKPSYLIIDIDPSPKNTFEQVVETAKATTEILEKAGATFYCKTSGATGIHIYVPLNSKYDYEHARSFGQIIATLVQEQLPGFTSLERSLSKRGNKIYIDYLQNSKGQTVASAYSVRPVDGAHVSAPLLVKELKKGLHPSQFTIFNIEKRIRELGDVFYMALQKGNNMKNCLKNLGY
ncbi:MAG: non-homologous end-joining DNA ligase [Bacteroidota bacterium]